MDPSAPRVAAPHDRRTSRAAVLALLAILALGLWVEVRRIPAVYDAQRVLPGDPDDLMRLYRVRQIVGGARVLIRDEPLINYPSGAELHWTAPVDALFAVTAAMLKPFIRHPDPVALVLAWIPPAMGLAYLVILFALVRALAAGSAAAGLLAALATAASPAFHRAFQLGHADHQCAMELMTLLSVYFLFARRNAAAAGTAIGLAIWIAPQALAAWLAIVAGLLVGAARPSGRIVLKNDRSARQIEPAPSRSRLGRERDSDRRAFSSTALAVVLIGYLVENAPNHLSRLHVDRISLFHVALLALARLAPPYARSRYRARIENRHWQTSESPEQANPKDDSSADSILPRAVFAALALGLAALFAWSPGRLFEFMSRPEFFRWSDAIMELQPLILRAGDEWSFANLHRLLGFAPYALPIAMIFFLRAPHIDLAARITLALLAVGFVALAILQRRWIDHVNVGLIPVIVLGAVETARRTASPRWIAPVAAIMSAIVFFPSARGVLTAPVPAPHPQLLRTAAVAEHIRRFEAAQPSGPSRCAILAEEGEGPMLLDRTGLPVVAVPYHRALDGIIEAARFYSETDPAAARAQLDRLGVRYVVVPLRPGEQLLNLEHIAYGETRSFDPPDRRIDADGNLPLTLHFRPRVAQTMAYRLAMLKPPRELGLRLLARTREGAPTPDGLSGLLYVVENTPTAAQPATAPSGGTDDALPRKRP